MLGDKIKVQSRVSSDYTDDQLLLIHQMGIKHVYAIFKDEHSNYDNVMKFTERLRKYDLTITDAGNESIYKNDRIHLGLPGRDEAIERYNEFNIILAKAGIPISYMTWEPNKVLTTRWDIGQYTRGAVSRIVELDELKNRAYTHGRLFTKEEMWENFKYWIDRVLPVCEEYGIKIALHPNDPPTECLVGISNLIISAEDYKHAFELAGDSPYLGMKMCVGCWLEGGDKFGNLLDDIKYFVERHKIFIVHFRNVSSPLPDFEETLLEDGYMDMYRVMEQFVKYDYDGTIHPDHVPRWGECVGTGGSTTAWTYSMGYLKGLLNSAIDNVNE